MKPYTVALQEASDLPMRERIEAEVRFARELELRWRKPRT